MNKFRKKDIFFQLFPVGWGSNNRRFIPVSLCCYNLNMAADLHSGTRSVNSPRKFEVETKFLVPPDFKQTLKTNGAWLKREIEFTDVYFDTPNNELTFAGFWLRKRDQKFELKIQKLKDFQDGIENYTEIEDEREIVSQLSRLLKACFANTDRDCTIEDFIQRTCCKPIASFWTVRTSYEMSNGVMVDLDQASFGYQVGEIEILVSSFEEVAVAKETIRKTAKLLGMHFAN